MEKWVLDPGKPHQRFFEEMTRIPHGSYHEEAYGDYLENFAKEHGFPYQRDVIGNVIIRKPAAPGYEDHEPLALQAHMDMVWAKEEGSSHDFFHDPLDLYIEDGFLHARGTTLGADDGTGVAYMLAVLDNPNQKAPALEAIFTVQEETGMGGALALKPEDIRSRRYISLDCGGGDSIYISSLAGMRANLLRSFGREAYHGPGYELKVSGLTGGYSDGYQKEQGNANVLAARLAYLLSLEADVRLSSWNGGEAENQIARESSIIFRSASEKQALTEAFERLASKVRKEWAESERNLSLTLCETTVDTVLREEDSRAVLSTAFLLPCGFRHKSILFPEIMSESVNWSVIRLEQESVVFVVNLRGSSDSRIERMEQEMRLLTAPYGFQFEVENSFPAWEFHDSELLRTLQRVFKEETGKELGLIPVQGGLECGVFARMHPEMDMIAMGPYGYDIHTPKEHLDLKNFDELFVIFCRLLENL